MTGRASPFAALTGAEKQIKWLEVQSVKLPFVSGSVDPLPEEPEEINSAAKSPVVQPQQKSSAFTEQRSESSPVTTTRKRGAAQVDFQKTRHQQYDAVIARMRQAELAAKQFHPLG